MQHVFWLIPGKLAGRSGPDLHPWSAEALQGGGIQSILSVNDGRLVNPADFHSRGMSYARIPFSDKAPPMAGDMEICLNALPKAFEFVHAEVQSGKSVLIHCTSGKDRTGLLMSYFLMRTTGVNAEEALRQVRIVRPIALNAEGWEEFGLEILRRV